MVVYSMAKHRSDYRSAMGIVSEFTKINTLPPAKSRSVVCNRYTNRMTGQYTFYVRRHIIRPLQHMLKKRHVFRYQYIKNRFEVM